MTDTDFSNLSVAVELIDVQQATSYLEKNFQDNRVISNQHVKNLASEMTQGAFSVGTDCIAFDDNGRLINGQHRLSAVIKSNTRQHFIVVKGLPPKVAQLIDGGKRRTMAERITIGGVRMTEKECACIRNALNTYNSPNTGNVEYRDKKFDDFIAGAYEIHSEFFDHPKISKHLTGNSFFLAAALKIYAEMHNRISDGVIFDHDMTPIDRAIHWLEITEKGFAESNPTNPCDTAAVAIRNQKERAAKDSRGARWNKKSDYRSTVSAAFSFMMGFPIKQVKTYLEDPFTSFFRLSSTNSK